MCGRFTSCVRHFLYLLAPVAIVAASCSSQTSGDSPAIESEPTWSSDSFVELEPTTTIAEEDLRESVINLFQTNLNRFGSSARPNMQEISDVLRTNEVFGALTRPIVPISFVEPIICDKHSISDLLGSSQSSAKRPDEFHHDIYGLDTVDIPDVYYIISTTSLTDIDSTQLRKYLTTLSDVFFRSSDKRCKGNLGVGPELGRSQSFTTGYFPETPANGFEIHNYVQFGDGPDQFARTLSLIILEPANSAIAIEVTAFNLRTRSGSKVTSEDMLSEITDVARDIKELWKDKIEADGDWLALNY